MQDNYFIFHLHSDLSTGTTNVDSVTKYKNYIDKVKELGMTALAFSEHGNIYEWFHKKTDIEKAGMKYVHACECYITESISEKIRDNYHCVLIARNYEGFLELNKMISAAFNREDGHFYYDPRISFDELISTSNNIIISTACLGGILHNGTAAIKEKFIQFLANNKERCFLEIQHHNDPNRMQARYNQYLYELNKQYGIPLIAGTDTHSLNDEHAEARKVLQKSKDIKFANEDDWDLTFKTYEELCLAYKMQNALPEEVYLQAIANTNKLEAMVEEFTLDKNTKYPKIYENSYEAFKTHINNAYKKHPYIKTRYSKREILDRVLDELDTYDKTGCIDFMLLQTYLRNWEKKNGINCGYGRGSVSGSIIAYILGVTEMDSMKFNLNFFRFLNPSRVTNADIDTDYSSKDRDRVKQFILKDRMNLDNIKSAEIITFNTIQMKGAIKDIGRALGMPIQETQMISDAVIDNTISENYREKYPELFKYVDIVTGVIVSVGTHPSGILVSDLNIDETVGLCTLSSSKYPVSMLNMKELDALMYVKLDILGLDNIGVINETCKLAGIDRLTPDNVDLNDEKVWKSIRDDTTLIFQWESGSAQAYIRKFMSDTTIDQIKMKSKNFNWLKWFSFGNGLLRPGCASFRDKVAIGQFYDNGLKELDEFLSPTMGYVTMQEDIMQFLVKFCEYSQAESDNVRRGIAKKYGTEELLPEIKERFIATTAKNYGITNERAAEIIEPFLQVVLDASSYSFSWNHSDSYSCIGYICGYLRYYYPLEFITASLNIFEGDEKKTNNIVKYAQKQNINIEGIRFRFTGSEYTYDAETKTIYKGMSSIKYLNKKISKELYDMRDRQFNNFIEVLDVIYKETSVNVRQLEILIKLNFFEEFGEIKTLLTQWKIFELLHGRKTLKLEEATRLGLNNELIKKLGGEITAKTVKNIDANKLILLLCESRVYEKTTLLDKIKFEKEILNYISVKMPKLGNEYAYVLEVNKKYNNKTVKVYRLKTGEIETLKVKGARYDMNPIEEDMIIKTIEAGTEKKWRKVNEEWVRIDETETILYKWSNVKC